MNIYALFSYFAQPTILVYLVLGFAIFRAWWARPEMRKGLRSIVFLYALLPLLALPATEHFVLGGLEKQNPPNSEFPEGADAIVVLSGDVMQPDVLRPEAEPGPSTLYRCLHAADLYRKKSCPVILSAQLRIPTAKMLVVLRSCVNSSFNSAFAWKISLSRINRSAPMKML